MPNSPDPLPTAAELDDQTSNPATESNRAYKTRAAATIGELRQQYGPHFAPGYGDEETLGHLLGRSGLNTLGEYLKRHHPSL